MEYVNLVAYSDYMLIYIPYFHFKFQNRIIGVEWLLPKSPIQRII